MAATVKLSGEIDGQLQLTTLKYDWTIKNVSSFNLRATEYLYSDPLEMDDDASWQAVISRSSSGILMLGLKFLGSSVFGPFSPTPTEFYCKMKDMFVCERVHHVFDSKSISYHVRAYGTLHEMLTPTAELTVTYYITKRKSAPFSIPRGQLLRDLGQDSKTQELTKITLVVNETSIKAHKEILAARSPVFAAMFNTKMAENLQNRVQINDVDVEVFKQLLQYIYTDKAEIKPTTAAGLLAAADKYDLDRLKAGCEHALFTYISVPTAIETLILADKHSAKQLKKHTLEYITTNANDVMNSSGWKTLVEFEWRSQLLLDVYRAMEKK